MTPPIQVNHTSVAMYYYDKKTKIKLENQDEDNSKNTKHELYYYRVFSVKMESLFIIFVVP